MWDLCKNTSNNINFHQRTNPVKINDKKVFWPILVYFNNFGCKKIFFQKTHLSLTTSYRFLASCQSLEKTNNTIPRKCPDRQKHYGSVG